MTTQRGFTLIELAIVLVILTILIGGLAVPLSAQIQARRVAETRQTLEEAREAILGYAMTHPADVTGKRHLPCPDTDTPPDGKENRDAGSKTCAQTYGLLPWVDLGTAPHDAWGNRLRYAVNWQYANGASGFSAGSVLNDPLDICNSHTCASPDVAANVVFVLVSHGPNGWGGRNVNGSALAAPSGADETANLDADRTYVSRAPSKPGAANGEFDDLLAWVPLSQLIAGVCPPGSNCYP